MNIDASTSETIRPIPGLGNDGAVNSSSGGSIRPLFNDRQSIILCVVLTLVGIGILMVYSASLGNVANGADDIGILVKQMRFVCVGLAGMIFGITAPIALLRKHSLLILALSIAALMTVYIPGFGLVLNGARRWVRLPGGVTFQPSEFSKLAIVLFAAAYSERFRDRMRDLWWGFAVPLAIIGFVSFFVLIQPDFGTCVLMLSVGTLIFLAGGMRISPFIIGSILAIPAFAVFVMNVPYRRLRVLSFIDPWADSRGAGYQLCQSLLAMGRGGVFGTGIGGSIQKLGFLPEANSDFILSLIHI